MIAALLVHWAPALTIPQAKADVRAALAAADGRTKDRTVRAAVDALAALNPTVAPARYTLRLVANIECIEREGVSTLASRSELESFKRFLRT